MENSQLTLLHIEDDDGDAKEVKRACAKEFNLGNYTLIRASSLEEAVLKLKKSYFNAVLLDLNLGDAQGLNNVRVIKEQNPEIPIVILSGRDDTDTALKAVRSGAQEYIVKGHSNSRMLCLAILSSIERKQYERHLFQLANHDELTGLPNRRAFIEYMKQWISRSNRWNRTECIMFMDVNGFKGVNDTLGHDVGDILLQKIATTLKKGLRASDMIARYAGDEFVVHLDMQAQSSKEDCARVADKIAMLFKQPFLINGHDIKTSLSIGIAFLPEHGEEITTLIRHADQAMYEAKQAGKAYAFAQSVDEYASYLNAMK